MDKKVLIVEDQFVEANDLQLMLRKAGYDVCGIARSVDIAEELIRKEKPGLVLLDIFLRGKRTGIDLAHQLKENNIAFIYLSANSNEEVLAAAKTTEPYGFIVKPFRERDLLVTLEIARYRHEHNYETRHKRESALLILLENKISGGLGWKETLFEVTNTIKQEIPFDCLTIDYPDKNTEDTIMSFLRVGFDEYQSNGINELSTITGIDKTVLLKAFSPTNKKTVGNIFNDQSIEHASQWEPRIKIVLDNFQMMSLLSFSVVTADGKTIRFEFYSRRPEIYSNEHLNLLFRLQSTLAKIPCPTGNLKGGAIKSFHAGSLPAGQGFEGMIGNSHLLLNVFDLITQVAPFDTNVLVLGESGTGKERIAECIHTRSPRQRKPLVKLNCAALPASLIESELFGHEKGSFTGAFEKRTGKFEQANGGTIFLDEIGEMPIDLQTKLLRVLQEKEIEPIGGKAPVKIDVRVIAATNRNLEKEIGEGRFRLDLYYRLNVFPIIMPPLRERLEDIPELVQHFVTICNRKSGKKISAFSDSVLKGMMSYHWPGNIRELENLIERSVLMAKGTIIEDVALPVNQPSSFDLSPVKTIHENERDYIIRILRKCDGKIWGAGGAAEVLGIPPSTLKSKMKKLDIQRGDNF